MHYGSYAASSLAAIGRAIYIYLSLSLTSLSSVLACCLDEHNIEFRPLSVLTNTQTTMGAWTVTLDCEVKEFTMDFSEDLLVVHE
jgi:hypothetical protein